MSKRLDHEAVNREERAKRQGREFVEPDILSEKQRDQISEGKVKLRKAAAKRDLDHKRSLAANLGPSSPVEAASWLRGLRIMISELPSSEHTNRQMMEKQVRDLEAFLRTGGRKKRQ